MYIQFFIVKKKFVSLLTAIKRALSNMFNLYHYFLRAFIDFQKIIILGRGFPPRRSQKPYVFSDFRFLFFIFFPPPDGHFQVVLSVTQGNKKRSPYVYYIHLSHNLMQDIFKYMS